LLVNKEEFLSLVWRLEEIMMHREHLRNQIRQCGEGCDDEDEGLCPACCDIFEKVSAEDNRLAGNRELDAVSKKLKKACDEDRTGEYKRILEQTREVRIMH